MDNESNIFPEPRTALNSQYDFDADEGSRAGTHD